MQDDISSLIASLKDEDFQKRRTAARALRDMHPLEAAEALAEALNDNDIFVRNYVTDALMYIGVPSLDFVKKQLTHENDEVRTRALRVFKSVGSERYTEDIVPMLEDRDQENRALARQILSHKMNEKAKQELFNVMIDPNKSIEIRKTALDILRVRPRPELEELAVKVIRERESDSTGIGFAATILMDAFPEGHDIFEDKLNDDVPENRMGAIITLAQRDRRAGPKIAEKLKDPEKRVREVAATTLGEKGSAIVLPYLEEAMKETSLGIWKVCRDAMKKIKERSEIQR